jgi:predicted PurR-regulated permease PerM
MAALSSETGQQALRGLLGVATGFFTSLAKLGIILVLSLYWSADRVRIERLLLSLIPVERRAQARDLWRDIENGVGSYIRSEFVQGLLAGVLLWLGYKLMGLEYPVLLALLGALAWLIPWLGALVAVVPPFLVGLGVSLPFGLLAAAYTLGVLVVMEFVVATVCSPPGVQFLLLVLVFAIMAYTFGLVGLLLAPPLVAAIQIFFRHTLNRETALELPPEKKLQA